jgi:hypothetical protein
MTVATIVKTESTKHADPRIVTFRIIDKNGSIKTIDSPGLGQISEVSMLLNPESLDVNMQQKVTPVKTIGGYVILHWGHDLDTITASGYSPAFYLTYEELSNRLNIDPDAEPETIGERGIGKFIGEHITSKNRDLSQGFRHFKAILDIYRHNGIGVLNTTGTLDRFNIGMIEIQYQHTFYRGHFESFNITETEDNPYSIQYNFVFKVVKELSLLHVRKSLTNNLGIREERIR